MRRDPLQKRLDALVKDDKFPAALAAVRDAGGRTRHYTAGVADLKTKARVPVDGQVCIASNTKMFTAVVVLQLVAEGEIALDAPVERYLPWLGGEGIDGRKITVRQLLQHTSGLPDYDVKLVGDDYGKVRHTYFEPRQLVDAALSQKALFAPGAGWDYSNTNYVLAGMVIQKVTGRSVGDEITRRIIKPLGLWNTYWPGKRDESIRGRHPHGYYPTAAGPLTDVTVQEPSMAWAAGQLIGTPSDLNRFMVALLDGRLLQPRQLRQMQTTVKAPDFDTTGTARYGLGLATFALSCGGAAWTHGGTAPRVHHRQRRDRGRPGRHRRRHRPADHVAGRPAHRSRRGHRPLRRAASIAERPGAYFPEVPGLAASAWAPGGCVRRGLLSA